MNGLDYDLIYEFCSRIDVPVIAHGGVGKIEHIEKGFLNQEQNAIAVGSFFVFQATH